MKYFFTDQISSCEERFQKSYDGTMGVAKAESDVNVQMVSAGWWVALKHCGVAVWFGENKPDFKAGDTVTLEIKKDIEL